MAHKKYALVLGGGGTKGIYEFGVWTALRELNIELEAVIGTSIGAINGMWIVQGDYEEAKRIWDTISLGDVLKIPQNFSYPPTTGPNSLQTLSLLSKILFRQGSLDSSPLKALIRAQVNPDKLRKSRLDFGIITLDVTRMKPREFFMDDLDQIHLADYLAASAAFPGFKETKFNGRKYMDGGLYDNVPYRTALKRGYRNIIVVNVSGLGIHHTMDTQGTQTVFIKNSIEMGHVLEFDRVFLNAFRHLGYLDTLRTFGKLEGHWYFLHKNEGFYSSWNDILTNRDFFDTLKSLIPPEVWHKPPREALRSLFPKEASLERNPSRLLMESAALALRLERIETYTPKELKTQIVARYQALQKQVDSVDPLPYQNFFKALLQEMKAPLVTQMINDKAAIELDMLLGHLKLRTHHPHLMGTLFGFFPYLKAAKVFIRLLVWEHRHRGPLALLSSDPLVQYNEED